MSQGSLNQAEFRQLENLNKNLSDIAKAINALRISNEKLNSNTDKNSVAQRQVEAIKELTKSLKDNNKDVISSIKDLIKSTSK